jgi:NAD(P)-dependent dehydrogenase (short-subunit alcohol dehydrogenase family)
MDLGITGKTAVVTGASRGIGRAVADVLAHEGAKVAIVDILGQAAVEAAGALRERGQTALGVQCDVADSASVAAAHQAVVAGLGPVDILVNNAGLGPPYLGKRIVEMPDEHWDKMLAVHLKGAFLWIRAAAPGMVAAGWGRIINLGSIHGISGGRPGLANYAAAKAGMEGLTRAASLELAASGVTVNCVAPGFTRTPMFAVSPAMETLMLRQTPRGRLAEPHDIAQAIAYLAGSPAAHITGETLRVDGGRFSYYLEQQ